MAILALITLLLLLPTAYLSYVRFSKSKLKEIKKKHPVGSPNFEVYRMLYSTRTLVTLLFLSVSFIGNLLVNLYKSSHSQGSTEASLLVLSSFLVPLGLYVWWSAKNKNKNR